jgi:hypothetical protein
MFAIRRHALRTRHNHQLGLLAQAATFKSIASRSLPVCSHRSHFPRHACHAGTPEGLEDVGNEYSVVSEVVDRALAATRDVSRDLS